MDWVQIHSLSPNIFISIALIRFTTIKKALNYINEKLP